MPTTKLGHFIEKTRNKILTLSGSDFMSNSNSNLLANMGDSPISDPVLLYRNELLQGLKEIIGDEKDLIGESIANIHGVLANTRSELLANSAIENLQAILPTSNDGFIQAKFEISVNNNNAQLLPPPMLLSASARSRLRTAAIAQAQDELKPLHVIIDVLKNISKQLNDALDNDNAATIVALLKNLTVIRETYENYLTTLTDSHLLERKALLEIKAQFYHPELGHYLINQELAREILCLDNYHQIIRHNKEGNHAVIAKQTKNLTIYFKPEHYKVNVAINPEMEHAMVSLQQLLSADPLIAAPSTWFKLRHVATQRINVEYIAPISIKAEELTAFLNYAEKKAKGMERDNILQVCPELASCIDLFENMPIEGVLKRFRTELLLQGHTDSNIIKTYPEISRYLLEDIYENRIVQAGHGINGVSFKVIINLLDFIKHVRQLVTSEMIIGAMLLDICSQRSLSGIFNENGPANDRNELVLQLQSALQQAINYGAHPKFEIDINDTLVLAANFQEKSPQELVWLIYLINQYSFLLNNVDLYTVKNWKSCLDFFRRFHLATEDQVITEKFTINYWIKLLDLDNIANLFDGCLMSGAKDAKHDNFMLREVFNKKLSLKLSSIDNDEAMAEEITANCDGKHISGIKLVFLTIPELLDLEVPESWKKKYRNLEEIDIMVLLFRFLNALKAQSERAQNFHAYKIITDNECEKHGIPFQLRHGFIKKLFLELQARYVFAASKEAFTFRELLQHLHPILFLFYQKIAAKGLSYNESYELAASATLEDILTTDLALPFRGQQTTIQQFLSEISITENDTVNHRTQTIEEAISEAAALSDLNALLNSSKIFIIKKLALLEQIAEFSTILPQITISIEILNELLIASILEAKPTAFTMVLKLQKNINYQDSLGRTALHLFCHHFPNSNYGDNQFQQFLDIFMHDPSLNVNIQNEEGETAIFCWLNSAYKNEQRANQCLNLLFSKKIDLSLTNKQQHTIIEHIIAYVSPKHLTGLTLLASFSPEIFNDNPALYTYLAKHYSPAIFETIEKKRSKIKTDVFYDFICSKMKLTDFPTGLLQALGISLPIAITSVSKRLATPHNIQSFATADNGQVWAFNNKSVIRFYADDLIDKTGNAIDCQTITDEADLEITVRGREMITAIAIYADKIAIGYSKGRIEIKNSWTSRCELNFNYGQAVTALTFNQDGNLISGHNDGKILTWRHKNYFCLSQENFAINSLNLLNKNSLVATSAQGDIKFYSGNSCFRWLRQQPALPKPLLVQINDDTIMTLNAANQLIFYQTNPFKEIRTINNPIEIYPQQNPTSVLICKLQDNLFAIANENKLAVFQVVAADCRLCLIHQWSLETHIHSLFTTSNGLLVAHTQDQRLLVLAYWKATSQNNSIKNENPVMAEIDLYKKQISHIIDEVIHTAFAETYFHNINRPTAEALLMNKPCGSFLFRPQTAQPKKGYGINISWKQSDNKVVHIPCTMIGEKITTADKNIKTLTALLLEQQANFRHPLTDIVALQSTNLTAQQIEISTAINQAVCRIYHSGKNEHLLHFFKLGSFLHQIDGRSAEKMLAPMPVYSFLIRGKIPQPDRTYGYSIVFSWKETDSRIMHAQYTLVDGHYLLEDNKKVNFKTFLQSKSCLQRPVYSQQQLVEMITQVMAEEFGQTYDIANYLYVDYDAAETLLTGKQLGEFILHVNPNTGHLLVLTCVTDSFNKGKEAKIFHIPLGHIKDKDELRQTFSTIKANGHILLPFQEKAPTINTTSHQNGHETRAENDNSAITTSVLK